MPQFTVIPIAEPPASKAVNVTAPEHVLGTVAKLDCQTADVLCDGAYAFTIQRGDNGMWIISSRRKSNSTAHDHLAFIAHV